MDLITFRTGETLYRPSGEHSFQVGFLDVVRVERTAPDLVLPLCLACPTQPLVKNLCGKFGTFMEGFASHRPVSSANATPYFGRHHLMYHLHGSVTVHRGLALFRGCAGMDSIRAIAADLYLESARCNVHMGVFKVCLGRRIATTHGCYMENRVAGRFKSIRVLHRLIDSSQSLKFRVDTFDPAELPYLTGRLVPSSVDITVNCTGVVMLRFSWSRCSWTDAAEAACLRFCGWVAEQLRECC